MIDHYSDFLKNEPKEKATIMDILCNEVVDFWKKNVLEVVKGGKTREVIVLISD